MRPSVAAAWPGHAALYEGRLNHMYLDSKALVTTGIGYLIDREGGTTPPSSALALPWLTASGARASQESVVAEWKTIKARTDLARLGGRAFAVVAALHLDWSTVDGLLGPKTAEFWARLALSLPSLVAWPADAQMAALDLSWQNGPAFLDLKRPDGSYVWPNMRAALLARDFTAAALAVPDPRPDAGDDDHGDRAEYRKRLFRNAVRVVALRLDPAVLWDTKTPTASPVVAPPKPAPAPAQETRMYSSTYRADYIKFRGGYFTLRDAAVLKAIPSTVRVTQGGLSTAVRASSYTHAGLGAFDLNTDGMTREQVWEMCRELLRCGIVPFPRGFTWDSFQGRTLDNTDDGNEHLHGVSNNSFSSLHEQAKEQIREWKRGGDGLNGGAAYTGPKGTPLGDWATSPYNPANIKAEPGRWLVQVGRLQGTNVDRGPTAVREKGEVVDAVKLVRRWGRWNAVNGAGTYYAIRDSNGTYLTKTAA